MKCTFLVALVIASAASAWGAEQDPPSADETAIRDSVQAYVAAYNKQDATALAALWSPDAVYTNPLSGEQAVGRAEIEQQFANVFAAAGGAKLDAKTEAVQFVSPSVAVEQGTATVLRADEAPEESEYTAIYVKRDGKWLLDRVTEEDVPVVQSNYDRLKDLEWMIGAWVDEDDQTRVETTCAWTKNRNFMTRSFTISVHNRIDMSGMQIVGWDPAAKQIRSWVFDSDGGFSEGTWSNKGQTWYIQSAGTLPDGQKASAVNIITQVDENKFTWQSINREAGGELLPNVDEVVVIRQATK